jgi:alkanesulfonate monooxygenase SsuD/methylene tetrahydromethanopterin reductase-like flavin-dependent oxidoreductase (luciferase family)
VVTTLGAIFLPSNPPERLPAVARAADEAGLEQLWLWEDCFLNSGIAAASAALASTSRLKVGIGILPVPFRNVALAAMEIATMRRLFGDRAIVGLGHGVQDWMEQVGVRAASPMGLLREYTAALRALLDGETVSTSGRYVKLDGVSLDWPPNPAPELLIGATGPRTLALSGELADGTILTGGTSPDGVRAAKSHIDQGINKAAAAGAGDPKAGDPEAGDPEAGDPSAGDPGAGSVGGRPGRQGHDLVVFVPAATGPGAAERLAEQQRRYGTDDAGVAGDAKAIAEGIERWIEAGATTIVLQPTSNEPEPESFVRFVAEEVRPLVN